ncbi:class I SAM-dependent methyltransferase [Myceligenerans xiligouense]|uniref:Methyltransferase family protein n=1 Tax=Myceligenerans xiligouense TaxID=253184 RepID=A0A3N4YTY6_9MICO|nr:class I SAM-dependent methyltransferase [Myceligenerans xiligouense]RPF22916.1 methyltransferase family protein [Myceligenerans xiligouense]
MTGRRRPLREIAVSFGEDAERYDRTRPGYPAALADVVLENRGGTGAPDVLDVGIGTGSAASLFRDAGCEVTGVEPDERMAALARRAGFPVESRPFDHRYPARQRYDVVVSGQAWHWVKQRAGAVTAAQVLRPGGRLAVFWNICLPEPPVAAALAEVYRGVDLGLDVLPWERSPLAGYEKLAGAAVAGIWGSRAFGTVRRHDIPWLVEFTRDAWVDQVPTLAWHERLSPRALSRVLDGNAKVIDALGGTVTMPYTTLTLLADRRPD